MFICLEYLHITYAEFWDVPIVLRHWLIERKQKEEKMKAEAQAKARKGGRKT